MRRPAGPERPEVIIARRAATRWGVVGRAELADAALSPSSILRRVRAGWLHELFPGAYAVGHPAVPWRGRCLAATLACGRGSAISHRAAAAMHDLRSYDGVLIDVTVPTRSGLEVPGVRIHRPRNLREGDVTQVDGIPCTSVTRTIVDLAGVLDERRLQSLLRQAERLRVLDAGAIRARLGRGVKGSRTLRRLLDEWRDDEDLRNDFEADFLEAIADARLPLPRCNVPFAGLVPDFRWPDHKLIVELDGWQDHGTRRTFEEDRARDARLMTLDHRVMRLTWRRFRHQRQAVMADLRALLA